MEARELFSDKMLETMHIIERAFEREVDDEYLQRIRDYTQDPISNLGHGVQKYAERGVHQLASALHDYEETEDKNLWRDYLDASYAELFLGVSPSAIEPVESCYANDERLLYMSQYHQVKSMMNQLGFKVPPHFMEPEDHIAMEWKFYLFLIEEALGAQGEAYDTYVTTARQFKKTHMDTWMNRACEDIIEKDDIGFYTGIANLVRAVLAAAFEF